MRQKLMKKMSVTDAGLTRLTAEPATVTLIFIMSFCLMGCLLLLIIMLFQMGSYLRLGQLFSLAAILIAVIIDGLLVTTKFARQQ